ncbi:MAG: two pore domain potassium channel family protein [Actinomycetia bacterium]|nr:two pore domain potassium channel family protein [Actinomycetes bacterium]
MIGESGTGRFPTIDRLQLHVQEAVRYSTRSFILVLFVLIAIYVVSEATGQGGAAVVLAWILAYVAFIVILRALGAHPRTVNINLTLMAAFLALAVAGLVTDLGLLFVPAWVMVSVYAFASPLLIMSYVLRQERITIDLIFGALCVYLFVGIDFAIIYDVIYGLEPTSFAFAHEGVKSLYYFSYMTLTTVGYGDITPMSGVARALTVVEAITGQILLVVMVARLIGIQIAQQGQPSQARAGGQ